MLELLQSFRIGVINLFGITVPGFLMIFFIGLGLFVPLMNIGFIYSDISWSTLGNLYYKNNFVFIVLASIVSYVVGYILRLSSPDDLDKISAKKVLEKLDSKEKDVWPYTGEEDDKYPYFNFQKYLKARNLGHLLKYVKWGDESNNSEKRSKTIIAVMKLDIMYNCPTLFSVVESNEAHIRLLSGTWLAIKNTKYLVLLGAIISTATTVLLHFNYSLSSTTMKLSSHSIFALLLFLLFISMFWAKRRIENLFHYRRVNELLFIVQSASMTRELSEKLTPHT